jgi:signal transduction histidine kinase
MRSGGGAVLAGAKRRQGILLSLAIAAAAQVEIWFAEHERSQPTAILMTLAWTLPIFVRGRWPVVATLVSVVALTVLAVIDPLLVYNTIAPFPAVILLAWTVGSLADTRRAVGVGLLALVLLGVLQSFADGEPGIAPADDLFFVALVGVAPWLAGRAMRGRSERAEELRERAARLEREREERAAAAAEAERARIARELHDIIAGAVARMTVQAGAARLFLREDPAAARERVLIVEEAGREALAEMRRLLGVLRSAEPAGPSLAPQPSLANLGGLLDAMRRQGVAVDLVVEGAPAEVGAGVDLAAFRVVEEALQNARAHAPTSRINVAVRYGADDLVLEVSNGPASAAPRARGYAVVAMRERVALYGGELEAGRRADGGYTVRARLPLVTEA